MKLCRVALFLAVSVFPTAAMPFAVNFIWRPIAGTSGDSADFFDFRFTDASGQLKISQLAVTLGSGLLYDTTNTGPGYNTWGPYSLTDGGSGATQTSAALDEGTGGNRTIAWNFTSFTNGTTLTYGIDVDESGTCAAGIAGAICRTNVDSVTPARFISQGGIDVVLTVDFINGDPGATFTFPASGQSLDRLHHQRQHLL